MYFLGKYPYLYDLLHNIEYRMQDNELIQSNFSKTLYNRNFIQLFYYMSINA